MTAERKRDNHADRTAAKPQSTTKLTIFATAALAALRVMPAHKKTGINMKYPMTFKPHGKTNQ